MPRWVLALSLVVVSACTPTPVLGPLECSADGAAVQRTVDGTATVVEDCLRSRGQLCEAAACVAPWRVGSPAFFRGTNARATPQSLAAKAGEYDAIALRLHLEPHLETVMGVVLKPGVSAATATQADVAAWDRGENDGLWNSLYLASQAYRYGATHDAQALDTVKRLLHGEVLRMRITGTPGLFTRELVLPGIAGDDCPADPASYTVSADKHDNRWVQIRQDGCIWVVDATSGAWTKSTKCGLTEFAGACFLDNVSKDEYAGHVFALGAVWALVEDDGVRATAADLLGQVADQLVQNHLTLLDWDGRIPEHGRFYAYALDDFPGFNAAMALGFLRLAATVTGRADLQAFYDDCLLQQSGRRDCLQQPLETPQPYTTQLSAAGLFAGTDGCQANFNDLSMQALSLQDLIWFEREPAVLAAAQRSLDVDVMRADQPRALLKQHNAWFDFIWAAHKRLGPGSDGPAIAAVQDGIEMLQQFPASQVQVALTTPATYTQACLNRFNEPEGGLPRETADRCAATYLWWGDPYSLGSCAADPTYVHPPQGYLLPYWMGRYYGFISPEL